METFIIVFLLWLSQAIIAALINMYNYIPTPKNFIDFLRLTFAPYVIYCAIFNKKKLE